MLQQSLPFTVLKRVTSRVIRPIGLKAATVLTVYGIETKQPLSSSFRFNACCNSPYRLRYAPKGARQQRSEATMRSAHLKYLSEAKVKQRWWSNSTYRLRYWNFQHPRCCILNQDWLQQSLPFTVLKLLPERTLPSSMLSCNSAYRLRYWNLLFFNLLLHELFKLQQCLPFTVLKRRNLDKFYTSSLVATALTVYGIETTYIIHF